MTKRKRIRSEDNATLKATSKTNDTPLEVDEGMSRADWLADVEVAVTSHTPDPLAHQETRRDSRDR